MLISIRSDKKLVLAFINELVDVINSECFHLDTDLIIIKSRKEEGREEFSTPYTLLDLDYDSTDILKVLKELTVKDYSETKFDRYDDKPPLLYVFGKYINSKQVYIKVKIKGEKNKRILCLSFHYAESKMEFPYT